MNYKVVGEDIVINQSDFDLDETLDCGQAFRWEKIDKDSEDADLLLNIDFDKAYKGFRLNTQLLISQKKINGNSNESQITLHNTSESDFLGIWLNYFDLETDYSLLKKEFSFDKTMCRACEFAPGIRMLKQDKWEALCSFIISQNNNIPRIKGIISRMCEHYKGFPSYEQLAEETVESLAFLRAGFRAKYLIDAAQRLSSGELDLDDISSMDLEAARKSLMTIKGVGPKVAECALLYGMYRIDAFPVDVWIKRVMEEYYPNGLPECVKGKEGIAQQYLFHYIRNLERTENK